MVQICVGNLFSFCLSIIILILLSLSYYLGLAGPELTLQPHYTKIHNFPAPKYWDYQYVQPPHLDLSSVLLSIIYLEVELCEHNDICV